MKNAPIYSVTQVNQYIKGLLDRDGALAGLFVRGELSNYKAYPSGHPLLLPEGRGGGQSAVSCSGGRPWACASVRKTA